MKLTQLPQFNHSNPNLDGGHHRHPHYHTFHSVGIAIAVFLFAIMAGGVFGVYQHQHSRTFAMYNSRRPIHRSFYVHKTNQVGKYKPLAHKKLQKMPQDKSAKAIAVMNARTGKIIYQRNDNQPRKVASVAKLMTLYLVERKMRDTGESWNTVVPQTKQANLRRMSYDSTLGGFRFKKGHRYTVQQLFQAAVVESSNNATIALGEWVAGSNQNCVKLMNTQAHRWNLSAHFVSPSGLENTDLRHYHLAIGNQKNGANLLSARDVAIIAQHLWHTYPSITKTSSKSSLKIDGQQLNNVNKLLPGQVDYQRNLNVNGLKTGFTPDAGYCFVSSSHMQHKDPLITVVLHDNNEFTNSRKLIRYFDSKLPNRN